MTVADHTAVRIGLLDSGVDAARVSHVIAERRFVRNQAGQIETGPARADQVGHGGALARIMWHHAPNAVLVNAQVFTRRHPVTAEVVAAGLDWLISQDVHLITLSFGLRADRPVLRTACAAACAAGAVLLASAPARGDPVYPAAYPGVIRITGDARCAVDEISWLNSAQADFGAHVRPLDAVGERDVPSAGGASFAVAHACGLLARDTAARKPRTTSQAIARLRQMARFCGPERRGSADPGGR